MTLTLAQIKVGADPAVNVHFNPASLRVTTSNQFDDHAPNQVAKPTSFKLDVELLFDTTETGIDIHRVTRAIRNAAIATAEGAVAQDDAGQDSPQANDRSSHLKLVTLSWGTRRYQGYIESLNETLDFWSSDGVPLRSTLQISLKGTTRKFIDGTYTDLQNYTTNPSVNLPSVVATDATIDKDRITKVAAAAGDTSTGRGLAALNGIENMRGTSAFAGAGASASASAFASAGAGASAGASASASASAGGGAVVAAGAGAQLQAAAGFQMSGGISAGASAGFSMGASAGLSASAGLGASVGVGMAAGAGFGVGGGISAGAGVGFGASASFGASAGASASFGGSAGASAGIGFGASSAGSFGAGAGFGVTAPAGGGFSMTTSTSVTGFDGVTRSSTTTTTTGFDGSTRTTSSSQTSAAWGSASVGIPASAGAFAGLGASRTTLPGAGFNPDRLLPPPAPVGGANTLFDVSGRAVSGSGMAAASYSARAGVTVS